MSVRTRLSLPVLGPSPEQDSQLWLPGLFQVVSVRRARQTGRPAPPLKWLPSELHINHHHASFFFSWKVCAAIFILKSPYNWKVPTNRSTSSCFPMVPPKLGWEPWNAGRQRPVAWAGPRAGLGAAAGRRQGDAPRTRPPASGFHPVRLFRAPGPSSRSFRELRGRQNSGNDQPLLHNDRCSCLNFQWV